MAEALIILFSLTPIVIVPPEVFDTVAELTLSLNGGIQSPNRDLKTGYEFGAKLEYRINHPYIFRFGVDYSQAIVTDPHAPSGNKSSINLSADALVYRGRNRIIGYMGIGIVAGLNHYTISGSTLDSLNRADGVTSVTLNDKIGYRIIMGLRFYETFVFELSFHQTSPDFVYRRDFDDNHHSIQTVDGTFSVARVNIGYLIEL